MSTERLEECRTRRGEQKSNGGGRSPFLSTFSRQLSASICALLKSGGTNPLSAGNFTQSRSPSRVSRYCVAPAHTRGLRFKRGAQGQRVSVTSWVVAIGLNRLIRSWSRRSIHVLCLNVNLCVFVLSSRSFHSIQHCYLGSQPLVDQVHRMYRGSRNVIVEAVTNKECKMS